jgi:heptosyltransferase III
LPELDSGAAPADILVINVCRIGDTLLATPALRALARAWPQARITALGHPKRIEVLEHLPDLAAVGGITKNTARWRARLRGPQYDLALVYGFDESLVEYALRAAQRVVAFRQKDDALDQRLFRAVAAPAFQADHSVRLALRLTDALGVPHAGYRLDYRMTDAEARWADERLRAARAERSGPLIGLQIASFPTKAYRDWPEAHFLEFARRVRTRWPSAHFLLFGGAGDQARTSWLAAQLGGECTNLAGTLTLRQSAALMSRLDLYVGVDTGPTHLASCFDIPLVGLYHCYSPSRLIGALDHPRCYPVDHPRPPGCAVETPMAEITVETVFAAVERALRGHPPAA